ncbi:YihY/virulence factor BrkB family protein [Clostridium fallax]|uniref:Membrane protein n=1 Tax=Clostridium fallax TaxID=1533 RepID=A0A1M4VNT8_9CLOT|nr:YihY/virulence factor BrkB family protein [Clostridium fallax]SHE70510.1 membrane protein [Clostridium fallax]SQB22811.1 YihY family protein [Clostridium fallax]
MKRNCLVKKNCAWNIIKKLYKKVKEDDIFALASQLAYNLILSFFPFLIFLLTIIGASNLNENGALEILKIFLPISAYDLVQSTIQEVFAVQSKNLLWLSIILAIWTASSGFRAVIKGLNKAYQVKETRSYIRVKLISMLCTVVLALLILFTLFLLVFGDTIGKYLLSKLPFDDAIMFAWDMSRYIVVISMMILTFASLYHFTPSRRLGWSEVLPGAVISTIGWIGTAYIFSYYVNNFSNYSRFYGSLAAIFILMTWLFISSMILLFGGEVNAVLVEDE